MRAQVGRLWHIVKLCVFLVMKGCVGLSMHAERLKGVVSCNTLGSPLIVVTPICGVIEQLVRVCDILALCMEHIMGMFASSVLLFVNVSGKVVLQAPNIHRIFVVRQSMMLGVPFSVESKSTPDLSMVVAVNAVVVLLLVPDSVLLFFGEVLHEPSACILAKANFGG